MIEKNKSGYELLVMAGELVAQLTDSEGVLDDESEEALEEWFENVEDKIGAYWAVCQRLKSEAQFLKEQADRLAKRRRSMENAEQRIRVLAVELLRANEAITGERKIKRGEFTATLSRSKKTVITDELAVLALPEYVRTSVSVDKVALGADLKAGKTVDGARLEDSEGVVWR